MHEETRYILETAISISGTEFQSLTQVPTPLLAQAREQVFGVTEQKVHWLSLTGGPWHGEVAHGLPWLSMGFGFVTSANELGSARVSGMRKNCRLWCLKSLNTMVCVPFPLKVPVRLTLISRCIGSARSKPNDENKSCESWDVRHG